jgi:hypothetical protein
MRTPASGGGRCQLAGRAGNDDTRDTSPSVAQCVARLPVPSLAAAPSLLCPVVGAVTEDLPRQRKPQCLVCAVRWGLREFAVIPEITRRRYPPDGDIERWVREGPQGQVNYPGQDAL